MRSNRVTVEAVIDASLRRTNEEAAQALEASTESRTPVDTGQLRDSIGHDSDASGAVVGTSLYYAGYVHNGTNRQAPQPFFVEGAVAAIADLRRIYGGA